MDQPKIERLLRLMQMLSGEEPVSIAQLQESLGMSQRTVYRYVDTLKSAGLDVSKVEREKFRLLGKKDDEDVFGTSGETCGRVQWEMTLASRNILARDYPAAAALLKKEGESWKLDCEVNGFIAPCRFFTGNASEIRITGSRQFLAFVRCYVETHLLPLCR